MDETPIRQVGGVGAGGLTIYSLSGGKSLPSWVKAKKKQDTDIQISSRKKRQRERDELGVLSRIQLIQDLEFSTTCQDIKFSPNNEYLAACGIYSPQIRMFDLQELSMKFRRGTDSEVRCFQFLTEDWQKLALLGEDRTIRLHAKNGEHFSIRVPKFGRDMVFFPRLAELLVASGSQEVYRLNLELGQFQAPLSIASPEGSNCIGVSSVHSLIAVGCENGRVECFDPRTMKKIAKLDIRSAGIGSDESNRMSPVTALQFDDDTGLNMAVGTSLGLVQLYDIRSSKPLVSRDHRYDLPIVNISFHDSSRILSADKKSLKIWNRSNGDIEASIEPPADINKFVSQPSTGIVMLACEMPSVQVYFLPELGPAPKWCSFLDALTDEMQGNTTVEVFDDYKFITEDEVEKLGIRKMVGTPLLRGYMHGYFIDRKLYRKLNEIADPDAFKRYQQERIEKKKQEKIETRITKLRRPRVNQELAQKYAEELRQRTEEANKKEQMRTTNPLLDSRFAAMFEKEEFAIDKESEEYRRLNPADRMVQPLENGGKKTQRDYERPRTANQKFNEESEDNRSTEKRRKKETLEERIQKLAAEKKQKVDDGQFNLGTVKMSGGGGREVTFVPKSDRPGKGEHNNREERKVARRGIGELHLPDASKKNPRFWRKKQH